MYYEPRKGAKCFLYRLVSALRKVTQSMCVGAGKVTVLLGWTVGLIEKVTFK